MCWFLLPEKLRQGRAPLFLQQYLHTAYLYYFPVKQKRKEIEKIVSVEATPKQVIFLSLWEIYFYTLQQVWTWLPINDFPWYACLSTFISFNDVSSCFTKGPSDFSGAANSICSSASFSYNFVTKESVLSLLIQLIGVNFILYTLLAFELKAKTVSNLKI